MDGLVNYNSEDDVPTPSEPSNLGKRQRTVADIDATAVATASDVASDGGPKATKKKKRKHNDRKKNKKANPKLPSLASLLEKDTIPDFLKGSFETVPSVVRLAA